MAATGAANPSTDACGTSLSEWTVHLARLAPGKTIRAFLVLLAAAAGVGAMWGSLLAGAVAFALLLLSTSEYFFPVRFRLTADSAVAGGLASSRRMRWVSVRRVLLDDGGIKLSPLASASWLEPFRGVYLVYPCDDPKTRDGILQLVASHTGNALQQGRQS